MNKLIGRYTAPTGLVLALLAVAAEAMAGFGTKLGWWHYRTGLALFGFGAVIGGISALISLMSGVLAGAHRLVYRMAIVGIVLGLAAAGIPWSWSRTAKHVPPIHDVSTDTADPPRFSAVLPLRKDAENAPDYGGPRVAALQNRAYPDIQPLVLPDRPGLVFDRAVSVARGMGWDVVYANAQEGRIEATATTFWFGFKDDIVVRITPGRTGTRVDARSLSRVGLSDVGTNASRIRVFLNRMKAAG